MPKLLQSKKLRPGRIPAFAVERHRLTRRIDEGVHNRLTLVAVPAGHGKSVLLSQWVESKPEHLAFLTIDARDADPARLAEYLVAALSDAGLSVDDDIAALLRPGTRSLGDAFVDMIVGVLEDATHDVVIVFDDLDRVADTRLIGDIGRLVLDAPPNAHFVIASRADPSFSLQRLRARGEVTELRVNELRFTTAEAKELLNQLCDRALTDDQVALLVARTEGWPIAMQLAALSLRTADDVDGFIAHFAGDDRNVADFLSSEVMDHLDDDVRQFLLESAVLESIHPELCDAIMRRDDSARMLSVLEHQGLFVNPIDSSGDWYRCHRVVRKFLRLDLSRSDPDRPRELMIRAAHWWLERDEPAMAADYLIEAGEWHELEALVWEHAANLWDEGFSESVLGWIEAIPAPMLRDDTLLRLAQAATCTIVGRASVARSIVADLERKGGLSDAEQIVADGLVSGLVEQGEPPGEVLERVVHGMALVDSAAPPDLPELFGLTSVASADCYFEFFRARAYLLLGEIDQAFEAAQRALVSPGAARPNWQVNALGTHALLDSPGRPPQRGRSRGPERDRRSRRAPRGRASVDDHRAGGPGRRHARAQRARASRCARRDRPGTGRTLAPLAVGRVPGGRRSVRADRDRACGNRAPVRP